MTTTSALVATGHGYETGSQGRCTAFDGFAIVRNPLGGFSEADRARRVFPGKSGPGVTYGSHALYLMTRDDKSDRAFYIGVHHGGGRQVWRVKACFNHLAETVAALADMDETSLYSLLWGMAEALADTRVSAIATESADWRQATVDRRVRVSRQPAKGRAFVWIEPKREPGETDEQHALRCAFAKPSGVR